MNREYRVQLYLALKAFGFLSFLILGGVLVEFWLIATVLKLPPIIGTLVLILTIVLPFLFLKKIKQKYTKDAFLVFTSEGFSIVSSNVNDKKNEKTEALQWTDIASYKIRFTQSKMTYLDLYYKNGIHKKYGFLDNKSQKESLEGDSIFSIYFAFIKQHNLKAQYDEKIVLKPGFLTTGMGNVLLGFVSILFLASLLASIFINPKGFPFLLMGGMSLLILFLQRKKDKDLYEILIKKELE